MTNCINLIKALDNTNLRIRQQREDKLHALGMLGDIMHDLSLLAIGKFHFHKRAIKANALSATAGHHALVVHIVQGVLD